MINKPNNILFLIYDLDRGGPEARLLELVANRPPNTSIHIIVTSTKLDMLDEFVEAGAFVKVIPLKRAYLEWGKIACIGRYIASHNIGVINTFDIKGLIAAFFIKCFARWRIVHVFHHVNDMSKATPLHKASLKLLANWIDYCICNSNFSKQLVADNLVPAYATRLIYNGVDLTRFTPSAFGRAELRGELGIADEDIIIGTVANFRPQKDYPLLLNTFARLCRCRPNIRLICVGGGPLLDEMKSLAHRLGIYENVYFSGYVGHVEKYFKTFDLFLLTSNREGFPNVILQAMASRLPVISTAVGGCTEIISPGENGLLIDAGDSQALLEAIDKLVENRSYRQYIADAGFRHVKKKFSLSGMIQQYYAFYQLVNS